jgi:RNA binding exosome subunit
MKIAHNIKLSVFAYEEEDPEQIKATFLKLLPFDLEQEKLTLKDFTAQGFQERKIRIFEIVLEKERHTSKFLAHLKQNLDQDQRNLLLRQSESRLDQDLNFFIRLDKPNLMQDNKYWITDTGNCFHIRISIAAYPAKREAGLKVVEQWLS